MISEKDFSYLTFETVIDENDFVSIKQYELLYNGDKITFLDINDIISFLPNDSTVFVEDLSLLYQINFQMFFKLVDRTKKHNFKKKYNPIYFYITEKNLFFKDVSALMLKDYEEFKMFVYKYDSLSQVPNTLAGIVRRDLKYIMTSAWKHDLKVIEKDKWFYEKLEKAYVGGDIGLRFNEEFTKDSMYSFDIKSSYPAILFYKKFPIGTWKENDGSYFKLFYKKRRSTKEEFVITAKFKNIECVGLNQSIYERFIENGVNTVIEEERLERADEVTLTCTSLDFETIKKWYVFDECTVLKFYTNSKWSRLPNLVLNKIREYFYDKELSRDPIKKRKLNIIYGVFCNGATKYNYEFEDNEFEPEEKINPFPFSVGVFCSAYARKRLNDLLFDLRETACYWDTDCVKGYADDMEFVYKIIEKHNDLMKSFYTNGETWNLGYWQDEGIHDMIIIGKKQYIKNGVPKIAGANCKGYLNCDEKTIFEKAVKTVVVSEDGVKVIYHDKILKRKVL